MTNVNMISDVQQSLLNNFNTWKILNIENYSDKIIIDSNAHDLQNKYLHLTADEDTEDVVKIAGRIMSIRNSGMFIDLQDYSGRIQIFCYEKDLQEQYLKNLKLFDLGDLIFVEGKVRRTKRGELTISAYKIILLTKCLHPMPEKFHGLVDTDIRYRNRHIDLTMNQDSKNVFLKRSKIISTIRNLLTNQNFLEVETPMLHQIPGGASAKPFITNHNALDQEMFLRVAPELYLKRLIISGLSDKIFEINRCFRNEGLSPKHNPEFTSIEIYVANTDYLDAMNLTENIVLECIKTVKKINKEDENDTKIQYKDKIIDFKTPWQRQTMTDAIKEYTGVDFLNIVNKELAKNEAEKLGIYIEKDSLWGEIVEKVFSEKVEHNLIQPTHIIDLPFDISPLAKIKKSNNLLTERFETYVNCWEIANAFSELNDPFDQYNRFKKQINEKKEQEDNDNNKKINVYHEKYYFDADFIEALEFGMLPTSGLGIGIDRLVMLLTNSQSIRDVIAFPTMRFLKSECLVSKLE